MPKRSQGQIISADMIGDVADVVRIAMRKIDVQRIRPISEGRHGRVFQKSSKKLSNCAFVLALVLPVSEVGRHALEWLRMVETSDFLTFRQLLFERSDLMPQAQWVRLLDVPLVLFVPLMLCAIGWGAEKFSQNR